MMKKLVIRNVQVVGMHHYGRRELELTGSYHVELEPNNAYDAMAVAVLDGQRKVGNLKRDHAKILNKIISENKAKSAYYLRPLEEATVQSRRIGPQQTCAIAFKIEENDIICCTTLIPKCCSLYAKVMDFPAKK